MTLELKVGNKYVNSIGRVGHEREITNISDDGGTITYKYYHPLFPDDYLIASHPREDFLIETKEKPDGF